MYNDIVFNEVSLYDLGVHPSGIKTDGIPERAIDTFEIPGRSGDLTIDLGRWKNINISYDCYLDSYKNIDDVKAALMRGGGGYYELRDTWHEGFFRYARFLGGTEVTSSVGRKQGRFTLTFDCMPQRFYDEGLQEQELTDRIENNTYYPASPIIYCRSGGTIRAIRADNGAYLWEITVKSEITEELMLDCDTWDATNRSNRSANLNSYVTIDQSGEGLVIPHGGAVIVIHGGAWSITPRWYVL